MEGEPAHRSNLWVRAADQPGFSGALIILILISAFAFGWIIYTFASPYAGGSDSSGYLNFARTLTHGELLTPVRILPGTSVAEFGRSAYQPVGFTIRDDSGTMSPDYPIGYPIHVAIATRLIGSDNPVAVINVLLSLASLTLMYASCRYLQLAPVWSAGATLALAACPYFVNSALQPMSDLPAMTWALVTLHAAMRCRERASWAILCGAAASMAVLVRPSNLLLSLPVLVAFGLVPTRYALGALGALPGGLVLVYVNWRIHGTLPLWRTTGYGSPTQILNLFTADATQPFSIVYFRHHASYFILWIFSYLGPLVICTAALPFFSQGRTREWAIQAVWFLALILPYTVYQPAGDAWWYLRFLLPAFPSLIMLAAGGLSMMWDHFMGSKIVPESPNSSARAASRILPGVAASGIILLSVGWMATATFRLPLFEQRSGEKIYLDAAEWAVHHAPKNSIILASGFSGAIFYYTDLPIVRWDGIAEGKVRTFLDEVAEQRRPLYAVLWPYEVDEALRRVPGTWSKVTELGQQKIAVLLFAR